MKYTFAVLLISSGVALHAASCGTVAVSSVCNLIVNGNLQYSFSGFQMLASSGDIQYSGADIAIDVATGGGGTGLLTFSKVSNSNGVVFLANADQSRNFTMSYDVQITPVLPGTVQFTTPSIVNYGQSSALGSGFSSIQMILTNPPSGVSCQAIRNSLSVTQGTCNTLPIATTTTMEVGNLVSLTGVTGNVSFGSFSNLLNATFTPAPAESGVPEPSTWAMLGLGLAGVVLRARKR